MNPPLEPSITGTADNALTPSPPYEPLPAESEVTRLLSAGAQTDRAFGDQVIRELVGNQHRFAAPAYGYDAATVLGHALAARERRHIKTTVIVLSVVQWFGLGVVAVSAGVLGSWAFPVTTVIGLWGLWAANLLDLVIVRQILTVHLKRGTRPGVRHGFTGAAPVVPPGSTELYTKIRNEQDSTAGVVYYGGYVPFVGAGTPVRQWSFACLL
ncbi:MAG: hypothetical protein QOI83_3110, partial [Streptomycetaceae bacterium]|nr:hypothetical protein [Streptomycetaceae bacterium]